MKLFSFNSIIIIIVFLLNLNDRQSSMITSVVGQTSKLEKFLPSYRVLRGFLFNFIGRTDTEWAYKWNLRRKKVQKAFPKNQQFFCDPKGPGKRSDSIPLTVHRLTPGDIDVIGAIGDSLTAGNGAFATNLLQVLTENKGVAWSIGGYGTWHKFLTIPNILKVFNPKLYGYSISDGISTHPSSRFNVAEIGAMSRDILHEAKTLIFRMRLDPNVNFNEHWKFISILIGPNDFCYDICYHDNPMKTAEWHARDLIATLRYIRDNLPRTIVNIITPPNLRILVELRGKPLECVTGHEIECPCIINSNRRFPKQYLYDVMSAWQNVTMVVPQMEEFSSSDEFTVVNQPFLTDVIFPRKSNGNSDFTYMSLDCFHLSQKGYALASNAYWNNLLESYGQKSTNWKKEFTEFKCPTYEQPYIATSRNS